MDNENKQHGIAEYHYRKNRDVRIIMFRERWQARNLKPKGLLSDIVIASRNMTDKELTEYGLLTRERFEIYTDWIGLFQDEISIGVNKKIIEKLKKFSKTHPLPGSSLCLIKNVGYSE